MQVDGWALSCLFVYGHMCTGKTTTIKYVLQKVMRLCNFWCTVKNWCYSVLYKLSANLSCWN